MKLYENALYKEDVAYVAGIDLPWDRLHNKSILISGAAGLIGSFLIDVLMFKNSFEKLGCTIYAIGRNEESAGKRFSHYCGNPYYKFIRFDINQPLIGDAIPVVDVVLHLASNTHPLQYSQDPIGTITTNIVGTQNMLDFAVKHRATRFVFASSNEIYGENRGDVEMFEEHYCGYIDCNTIRAGYPESKRCGESLCQAYMQQRNLEVVIPRLTRSYGPTLLKSDTKALSQFIHKAIAGEDIVLKSSGTQFYSYLYVADTVSGLLTVLLKGEKGEAYNVADPASDMMLKDLAAMIAAFRKRKVVYEIPDAVESAGYSKATKARLESSKLRKLGWTARYDIAGGIGRTLDILEALD